MCAGTRPHSKLGNRSRARGQSSARSSALAENRRDRAAMAISLHVTIALLSFTAPHRCALRGRSRRLCAPTASVGPDDGPIDPRRALEEFGSLIEQVKELNSEWKNWTPEERSERRRTVVSTYVRVFAPAVAFSGVQLGISLGAFALILISLTLSGRGYTDVAALCEPVPFLRSALENLDPTLGNAAIALLAVELCAPALIASALLAAPAATRALEERLSTWNLDADGLNTRIERLLGETPPAEPAAATDDLDRCQG